MGMMKFHRRGRALMAALLMIWTSLAAGAAADDELDLEAYRGQVVVLDFWASWCVPCRRSFPWLNAMHARYADKGLVIIGVNLDNAAADAAAFLEDFPPQFRIHYDTQMTLARRFEVQAMPSSFVIGRDGEVKAKHLGFKVKRQDEYEAILVEALGEETQ